MLFSMRNFWYVRIFESVIRELARRGHAVHICAEQGEGKARARDWNEAASALSHESSHITFEWTPRHIEDDWVDLRVMVHLGLDYLRFLEPEYANAPVLGARARERTPPFLVRLANLPLLRTRTGLGLLAWALRIAERAMPFDAELAAYVGRHRPDVLLITPLLTLGSEQQDVLRAARSLGVPSALCVGSWDHLSSKALLRQLPDRVFVWNEIQREEAIALHGMSPEAVTVTGAQCFDQWFDRQPTLDREAFCRKVGLDPARPFILYACSALFEGSPNEAQWVVQWMAALRQSGDARLAEAGILIRPHPKRGFEWDEVDVTELPNVSLWPPTPTAPFDAESKADYFDSMFHSAAVVGLNTSALIEAGIVGRAVHTILLPEFEQNQEGTLHFHYLLDQGLLRSARSLSSHLVQLAEAVGASNPAVHHNRAFVEQFVRPYGLATPATPLFADGIESLAQEGTVPHREPRWLAAVRIALTPLAWYTSGTFANQVHRQRRRRLKLQKRQAERSAAIARREQHKRTKREERMARVAQLRLAKQERRERTVEAKLQAREAWRASKRRRQQRQLFNARVTAYYRRLIRRFSIH